MKILSYNINGLKSFSQSKLTQLMIDFEEYDVMCFQETKYSDFQGALDIMLPYPYYTHMVYNDIKKGYAGVMNLMNKSLYDENRTAIYDSEISIPFNDDLTYTDGRILKYEFRDFYIINVYTPNSGNKEELRKYWDEKFTEEIKNLNKPVIICGDLNVCSTELDYWGNYKKAINTTPGLMDFEINGFEKLCKECNLVDAFRFTHPDERKYSWYSTRNKMAVEQNKGWRLDYFLVSDSLKDKIVSCNVVQGYQAPDHSPITLDIDV